MPSVLTGYAGTYSSDLTSVTTTLTVPVEPPASGVVYLWPGLQPNSGSSTYEPIGLDILQPVLTWGGTCFANAPANPYASWWISGEYVNSNPNAPAAYAGCHDGAGMDVNVGDTLNESMVLSGTTWTQTISDVQTGNTVTYAIDLKGQTQQLIYFVIEDYGQNPAGAIHFTNTSFTFDGAPTSGCYLTPYGPAGPSDSISTPTTSNNGQTCSFADITISTPMGPIMPNGRSSRAPTIEQRLGHFQQ